MYQTQEKTEFGCGMAKKDARIYSYNHWYGRWSRKNRGTWTEKFIGNIEYRVDRKHGEK